MVDRDSRLGLDDDRDSEAVVRRVKRFSKTIFTAAYARPHVVRGLRA